MSPIAKPARIAIRIRAAIHLPILEFVTLRKKESIGVPVR
jgi:hypothetical protein